MPAQRSSREPEPSPLSNVPPNSLPLLLASGPGTQPTRPSRRTWHRTPFRHRWRGFSHRLDARRGTASATIPLAIQSTFQPARCCVTLQLSPGTGFRISAPGSDLDQPSRGYCARRAGKNLSLGRTSGYGHRARFRNMAPRYESTATCTRHHVSWRRRDRSTRDLCLDPGPWDRQPLDEDRKTR